jgi:dihydrofolate reductase
VLLANYIYIAASIDGYIADLNCGVEWLDDIPNPDDLDFGFAEYMNKIDAVLMGKNSYEKLLTFEEWVYEKPVYVLSNSWTILPKHKNGKAELINGVIISVIDQLKTKGMHNLYIDGGKLIQSFLKEDLIDELIITTVPIILGSGIPLFGEVDSHLKFKHLHTEVFNNFLVKSHYIRDHN